MCHVLGYANFQHFYFQQDKIFWLNEQLVIIFDFGVAKAEFVIRFKTFQRVDFQATQGHLPRHAAANPTKLDYWSMKMALMFTASGFLSFLALMVSVFVNFGCEN